MWHRSEFVSRFGKGCQVVGDDLTVTNPKKISRAVKEKVREAAERRRLGLVEQLCEGGCHLVGVRELIALRVAESERSVERLALLTWRDDERS